MTSVVPGVKLPLSDSDFLLVLNHFFNTTATADIAAIYSPLNYK